MRLSSFVNKDWAKAVATNHSLGKAAGILILAAILFTLTSAVAWFITNVAGSALPGAAALQSQSVYSILVSTFLIILIGGLFLAWVVSTIAKGLGGKGGYFEGLVALSYPTLLVSIGALLATLVSYSTLFLAGNAAMAPVASMLNVVAIGLYIVFAAVGFVGYYSGVRSLFGFNDYVAPLILWILVIAVIAAAFAATPAGPALIGALKGQALGLPGLGLSIGL